jgi:hypothetical protein
MPKDTDFQPRKIQVYAKGLRKRPGIKLVLKTVHFELDPRTAPGFGPGLWLETGQ